MSEVNGLSDDCLPESFTALDTGSYDRLRDRIAGTLLGSAVADALGWPTEFIKTRAQLQLLHRMNEVTDFLPWEKRTGGRFNTYIDYLQPGEYSDDTQLTLAVARSIRADGSFDPETFAKKELRYWLDYARGAGATITRAARAITRRDITWDSNFFSYERLGRKSDYTQAGANGAAMRASPHALANIHDERQALSGTWQDTVVTHGNPRALWGALLYSKTLQTLLNWNSGELDSFIEVLRSFASRFDLDTINSGMEAWLKRWAKHTSSVFEEAFDETRGEILHQLDLVATVRERPLSQTYELLGCLSPATKGSGTATVSAALAVFLKRGGSYEGAVLKAINMLGSDTDTIGAMVGGMVGALKGQMAIPDRWATKMQDYGYFIRAAEALTRIALREAKGNDLVVDHVRDKLEDRDIVSLAKSRRVQKGQRVTHDVLGLGWVKDVHSQQIKRRGGGTMLLTRVDFDMGQSCIFRSYVPAKSSASRSSGGQSPG